MNLETVSRYIIEHADDSCFTYFEKDKDDNYFSGTSNSKYNIKLTDSFEVLQGMGGHPVLSPQVLVEFAKTVLLLSERYDEAKRKLRELQ